MQEFTAQVEECKSLTALCIMEKRLIEQRQQPDIIAIVSNRIDTLLNLYAQDD